MTKEEIQDRIEQVAYDGATDGCNHAVIERDSEKLATEIVESVVNLPDTPDDEIYNFAMDLHNSGKIRNAALLVKRHTTMSLEQAKQYCYSHYQ